ncbi:hypothetical protein HY492_02390 [Candidatus Woesearchaeota archaeon]|nr:hypothetical protein [Candidatus Woesearchaeota archaeon]
MNHPALNDVRNENAFNIKDGGKLKNLYELERELRRLSKDQFSHHVNDAKNDFYNWIYHAVKDDQLALRLAKLKDQKKMADVIEKRIGELERLNVTKKQAVQKKTFSSLKRIASKPVTNVEVDAKPLKHEVVVDRLLPSLAPLPDESLLPKPVITAADVEEKLRARLAELRQSTPFAPESYYQSAEHVAEDSAAPNMEMPTPAEPYAVHPAVHYTLLLLGGVIAGLVIARFFI